MSALLGLTEARALWQSKQPKKPRDPDPDLRRDLCHGWLLPYLLDIDDLAWGRWDYWARCAEAGTLPADPIPRLEFAHHHSDAAPARKVWERCLGAVERGGSWRGWSSSRYVEYLLDWLLFGFGHAGHRELSPEPSGSEGASMRLYQVFDLAPLLLWPYDHLAELLCETNYGRGAGFFPTPHTVVAMMTAMLFGEGDHRTETVCDPCCGTGRMPLHASNHSLRLYGQDIDAVMCKCTLVHAYLWAPWLAKPLAFLDRPSAALAAGLDSLDEEARAEVAEVAAARSDAAVEQAPPHLQMTLFDTEFDAAGTAQAAPILKRRRRETGASPCEQASLFEMSEVSG